MGQRYLLLTRRVLLVVLGADKIKVAAPVWAIREDWMRLGKEGMYNVSSLDIALCASISIMNIFNDI